jgi:hypothetical protein
VELDVELTELEVELLAVEVEVLDVEALVLDVEVLAVEVEVLTVEVELLDVVPPSPPIPPLPPVPEEPQPPAADRNAGISANAGQDVLLAMCPNQTRTGSRRQGRSPLAILPLVIGANLVHDHGGAA